MIHIKPLEWAIGEDRILRARPEGLRFGYNIKPQDNHEFELTLVEDDFVHQTRICPDLDMAYKRANRHFTGIIKGFLK